MTSPSPNRKRPLADLSFTRDIQQSLFELFDDSPAPKRAAPESSPFQSPIPSTPTHPSPQPTTTPRKYRTPKRPMPDQTAFESKSLEKTPRGTPSRLPPPTPVRTPQWARKRGASPRLRDNSLSSAKLLLTLSAFKGPPSPSVHFHEEFDVLEEIGSGSSAVVFKVRHKGDGKLYAVKRSRHQYRGVKERDSFLQEVRMFKKLGPSCRHIIVYYRAWQEDGYLYTQSELCERGNLKEFQDSFGGDLPDLTLWLVLRSAASGLDHMHSHNLLHLDIKPQNIFLTRDGLVKIGDLGQVREVGEQEEGVEGDNRYMAKELLNGRSAQPAADIFSLGLSLYELAANIDLPCDGQSWQDFRKGCAPPLPEHRPPALCALISRMMDPNPAARPTASQILDVANEQLHEGDGFESYVDPNIVSTPLRSDERANRRRLDFLQEQVEQPAVGSAGFVRPSIATNISPQRVDFSVAGEFMTTPPARVGGSASRTYKWSEL